MGSKLAWPSSRPYRMRSRSSSKSALREDIAKRLHARLFPANPNDVARRLDYEMPLERKLLELFEHILAGQSKELPIGVSHQRIVSNTSEMKIVSKIRRCEVR